MGKLILAVLIGYFTSFMGIYAQGIDNYPIPSFDVTVEDYACFREDFSTQSLDQVLEKRQVNVRVKSCSPGRSCTVWVFSLDRVDILGPFTVSVDETLGVEIDEREWGVLVQTEEEVVVDVWIGESLQRLGKNKFE
jgi:hypothetical protein